MTVDISLQAAQFDSATSQFFKNTENGKSTEISSHEIGHNYLCFNNIKSDGTISTAADCVKAITIKAHTKCQIVSPINNYEHTASNAIADIVNNSKQWVGFVITSTATAMSDEAITTFRDSSKDRSIFDFYESLSGIRDDVIMVFPILYSKTSFNTNPKMVEYIYTDEDADTTLYVHAIGLSEANPIMQFSIENWDNILLARMRANSII